MLLNCSVSISPFFCGKRIRPKPSLGMLKLSIVLTSFLSTIQMFKNCDILCFHSDHDMFVSKEVLIDKIAIQCILLFLLKFYLRMRNSYNPSSVSLRATSSFIVMFSFSNSAILPAKRGRYFLWAISNSLSTLIAFSPDGMSGFRKNACITFP